MQHFSALNAYMTEIIKFDNPFDLLRSLSFHIHKDETGGSLHGRFVRFFKESVRGIEDLVEGGEAAFVPIGDAGLQDREPYGFEPALEFLLGENVAK